MKIRSSILIFSIITIIISLGFLLPQQAEAGPQETCEVTVETHDSAGIPYSGAYTQFFLNGDRIQRGFSPQTIELECGVEHEVRISNYRSTTFNQWWDTGSTDRQRFFTVFEDIVFVAHMNRGNYADIEVLEMENVSFGEQTSSWTWKVMNNGPRDAWDVIMVWEEGAALPGLPSSPDIVLSLFCTVAPDKSNLDTCNPDILEPGQCLWYATGVDIGPVDPTCNIGHIDRGDMLRFSGDTSSLFFPAPDSVMACAESTRPTDPDLSNNCQTNSVNLTPTLTIKTVDKAGNERIGADFVNFFDAADLEIFNAAGFAPATLSMYDSTLPIAHGDLVMPFVLDFDGPVPGPSDEIMFYKWLSSPGNLNGPMVPKGALFLTEDTVWTAVMMGPSIDPPGPTTCEVTVETHDSAGIPYSGAYTQFFLNGDRIQRGFSPQTIELECGVEHEVRISNYRSTTFNQWWDTGSTDRQRFFTVFEDIVFVAHMNRE